MPANSHNAFHWQAKLSQQFPFTPGCRGIIIAFRILNVPVRFQSGYIGSLMHHGRAKISVLTSGAGRKQSIKTGPERSMLVWISKICCHLFVFDPRSMLFFWSNFDQCHTFPNSIIISHCSCFLSTVFFPDLTSMHLADDFMQRGLHCIHALGIS